MGVAEKGKVMPEIAHDDIDLEQPLVQMSSLTCEIWEYMAQNGMMRLDPELELQPSFPFTQFTSSLNPFGLGNLPSSSIPQFDFPNPHHYRNNYNISV